MMPTELKVFSTLAHDLDLYKTDKGTYTVYWRDGDKDVPEELNLKDVEICLRTVRGDMETIISLGWVENFDELHINKVERIEVNERSRSATIYIDFDDLVEVGEED